VLRSIPLDAGTTAEALDGILRRFGDDPMALTEEPIKSYKIEREFLDQHTVIPLLYLPRAWAIGARLRDLHLNFDGSLDLANANVEDAQ
jgi:peptide/nickel transport system substrate-binding protein